jgi:hypothetical protein
LSSGNWTEGSAGWAIGTQGNAEFWNVKVRGELNASDIVTGTLNVSQRIADLAIQNAKIGNLQISTAKIQDNAVTIPVSAYSASGVARGTLITAPSTNFLGQPVFIIFTCNWWFQGGGDSGTYSSNLIRIRRNPGGVVLYSINEYAFHADGDGLYHGVALSFRDNPPASAVTYYVDATGSGDNPTFNNRSIMVLGVQK